MGLYDREYYREEGGGFGLRGPSTVAGTLILINVLVYFADQLLFTGQLSDFLAVYVQSLVHPLEWWRFLTYGFVHSARPMHIIGNMLGLWFFGRDIELTYGRKEFLRLYLTVLVAGSLVWAMVNRLQGFDTGGPLMGASGAVTGVVVLFALLYPQRQVLFMFFIPMPAWVLGVILVAFDIMGAMGMQGAGDMPGVHIAYSVHLTGAAFALLYYRFGWNLGRLLPSGFSLPRFKSRPRLRVHDPDGEEESDSESDDASSLSQEVDRILEKIHQQGESSLTRRERRTLETASRQYQQRRRQND